MGEATARSACYRFLAGLILRDPEPAFLEELRGGDAVDLFPPSVDGPGSDLAAGGLGEMRSFLSKQGSRSLDEIRIELSVLRTRLFRGISAGFGPPPPYEALHRSREGTPEGDLLLQVQRFYLDAGAGLPEGYAERADYLGLELELMGFLCEEESTSSSDGDTARFERVRLRQRSFLGEHLLRWVPAYCRLLAREAGCGFYGGMARLLEGFLASEAALFDIK